MIVLCMIVRNEARTIVQTLESVLPYVGDAVIVDTGSTDDTVWKAQGALMKSHLTNITREGVGGHWTVQCRPWVDFSTNRNECLEIARERIKSSRICAMDPAEDARLYAQHWLLMLDGDSVLEPFFGAPQEFHVSDLQAHLRNTKHNALAITLKLGTLRYPSVRLFRADSDWRYVGKVHEVPISASGAEYGYLPESVSIRYLGTDVGEKFTAWHEHVKLLESQMREERGENPRTVLYLAQTHACLMQYGEAAQYYELRLKMRGGWEPERWETRLRLGCLDTIYTDDVREAHLIQCTKDKPERAEPWFYLAEIYAVRAETRRGNDACFPAHGVAFQWERAYLPARIAVECVQQGSKSSDLFLRKDIYDYRAYMLLGVCAYQTGRNKEARRIFEALTNLTADDRCRPSDAEVLLMKQHLADIELQEERTKK